MQRGQPSPFSPRTVLGLVLFGTAVFVALLWMIGAGMTSGDTNNGGGHAGGKGLNGYAFLAGYLEKRGFDVVRLRSEAGLDDPGLLILTPPQQSDPRDLQRIVENRRTVGPTAIVVPKWIAFRASVDQKGAKDGWVNLMTTQLPEWPGFYDDITLDLTPEGSGQWHAIDRDGSLPAKGPMSAGRSTSMLPLVIEPGSGRMLAGYEVDDGYYPALEDMALAAAAKPGDDESYFPVIFVFEPDLLDNYGMKDRANAEFAEQLVTAALDGTDSKRVVFDLTLNGLGRSANLLTLAFTPPFLAATLCLLMAALAVGWRGFVRFGPPRVSGPAIAYGKRALVDNAAGLIRRSRRLHLIVPPWLASLRERLAHALGLPRLPDAEQTDAAIDRALAARDPLALPFSAAARRLAEAHRTPEVLRAAHDLHELERKLTR